VATISRLREKEGRQKAVPVLVLFEPALVLPDHSTRRGLTVVALFFHPPTHPQIKRKKKEMAGDEYTQRTTNNNNRKATTMVS